MTMELERYQARVGTLDLEDYARLYELGLLPFQEKAPNTDARRSTRDCIGVIASRFEGPVHVREAAEYLVNGILEAIITPMIIYEDRILEPALILGGYRTGTTISTGELEVRLDERIDEWARRILTENRR